MFARALIVQLLVLNLGVAAWGILRPAPTPGPVATLPANVPRLQLLSEAAPRQRAAAVVVPAPVVVPDARAEVVARCFSFGPFADASTLAAARAALQPLAMRVRVRDVAAGAGRGWRVWLAPLADRTAAQAAATRIAAAGFEDYYIVPDGAEVNSIALGRYGSKDAAQRRAAALQAAGFPAQAQALEPPAMASWIDVGALAAFDAAAIRTRIGAAQVQPLDCAKMPVMAARTAR